MDLDPAIPLHRHSTDEGMTDASARKTATDIPAVSVVVPVRNEADNVAPLAEEIYQQRAFERLPLLADALEEASCDDNGLLAHFRGAGLHVRGCWALDAILT